MPTLARDKSVLKCPQCGLVTFDDLPACPRCKESFALVRPLASTSLDGARHVLRDDPELRLKLRERLHRARLDRRKRNENPMALGPDPDAPDWFEPDIGGGNGAAEAATAPASGAAHRSKESTTVPIDDHTADDDVRAGTTTSDSDSDPGIIEASREAEDGDAPAYSGDIPGFSDWREELRERLKRIRARREQERLAEAEKQAAAAEELAAAAEAADAAELAAAAEVDEDVEAEAVDAVDEDAPVSIEADAEADVEVADAALAEDTEAEVDVEQSVSDGSEPETASDEELAAAPEAASEEIEDAHATAGDLIARIVDGPGKRKHRKRRGRRSERTRAADADLDFTLVETAPVAEADDDVIDEALADASEETAAQDKEVAAIVLGEKDAEPAATFDLELDGLADELEEDGEEVQPATGADADADKQPSPEAAAPSVDDILALDLTADEAASELGSAELREPDGGTVGEPLSVATPARADRRRKRGRAFDWGPIDRDAAGHDAERVDPTGEGDLVAAPAPADVTESAAAAADAADSDEVPELDFDAPPAVGVRHAPEIDLPETDDEEAPHGLAWDSDAQPAPRARSSVAPLGERAAAALCDALVLIAIGAALVAAASLGAEAPYRRILLDAPIPLALTWAIFASAYSVFLVGSCGQTIGRMVMRLRVVGEDRFSVGFMPAALRLAAWVVSALPAFAGMLPALRDPQRRALHDRLSRTRVVKA